MAAFHEQLASIYYNTEHPAAFSNLKALYNTADPTISKQNINSWLEKQKKYTLHRPKRKRFPRNYYDVNNIGDLW
jgi:hypothetical protein